ncbi:xylulokinase [Trueperella sp. LYQ141]|uniref:xylulokinase n=1 Tax=Trueperella sp. LYQ141 TaxID=3391058 RepID=UPI003983C3C3
MSNPGSLVLGVDASTQSVTVEARRSEDFTVVGSARIPLARAVPPCSEQDPHSWWAALSQCLSRLRADGIDTRAISAIAVGGQCHGLVALDSHEEVIRPAKLWNDTTGAPYIQQLVREYGSDYWANICGSVPTAAFTVAKLAYLAAHEPDTCHRLARILLPHDYLNFRLSGEFFTDRSEASGTGYFDSRANEYRREVIAQCLRAGLRINLEREDVRTCLPPDENHLASHNTEEIADQWAKQIAERVTLPEIRSVENISVTVSDDAAAELGLSRGVRLAPGGGDQHLAAAGIGLTPGDLCFSLGTSGVVFTISDTPIIDPSGMIDGVASVTGTWQPLVCTLNCTLITDHIAQLFGVDVDELGQYALAADISAPRPVMAAYFGGERSPQYPNARGLLAGISSDTGRAELACSAFEGVIFGLLRGVRNMNNHGIATDGRVLAVGGGARSAAYRQLLADHLQRTVASVDVPEATARGAALQAMAVLHGTSMTQMCRQYAPEEKTRTHPRALPWPEAFSSYLHACELSAAFCSEGASHAG